MPEPDTPDDRKPDADELAPPECPDSVRAGPPSEPPRKHQGSQVEGKFEGEDEQEIEMNDETG